MRPFPQTLSVSALAPRSNEARTRAQKNQPRPTPFVAEGQSKGPQAGGICAANAQSREERRARPRGGAACRNTMAMEAMPANNSLAEDQRLDAELLPERLSRPGHILQTCLATRDQRLLHRPFGELFHSGAERSSTLPTVPVSSGAIPDLGSPMADSDRFDSS